MTKRIALYVNEEAWKVVDVKWPPLGGFHVENVAFKSSAHFFYPIFKTLKFRMVRVWQPAEFYVGFLSEPTLEIKENGNLGLMEK